MNIKRTAGQLDKRWLPEVQLESNLNLMTIQHILPAGLWSSCGGNPQCKESIRLIHQDEVTQSQSVFYESNRGW